MTTLYLHGTDATTCQATLHLCCGGYGQPDHDAEAGMALMFLREYLDERTLVRLERLMAESRVECAGKVGE